MHAVYAVHSMQPLPNYFGFLLSVVNILDMILRQISGAVMSHQPAPVELVSVSLSLTITCMPSADKMASLVSATSKSLFLHYLFFLWNCMLNFICVDV